MKLQHEKLKKIIKGIDESEKALFANYGKVNNHDSYPIQDVYIIFESKKVRDKVLADYARYEEMASYMNFSSFLYKKELVDPTSYHKINL